MTTDTFVLVPYATGRVDVQIPREPDPPGVVATDRLGELVDVAGEAEATVGPSGMSGRGYAATWRAWRGDRERGTQ